MKFDVRAAAVAAGSIADLAYALCAAFYALVPEPTAVYVTAGVLHINSTGLERQMALGTVVVGLLVLGPRSGVSGWRDGLALQPYRANGRRKVSVYGPRERLASTG